MTSRDAALKIVHRLRQQGHQAYLVGGCVRDILLGREVHDHDIATSASPDEIFRLFPKTLKVGAQFGVAMVGMGGRWIEVATFRCDEGYTDGRHPDRVRPGSIEEDTQRRDFTINGMFLDPATNEVVDLVGGKSDLENRIIRAIGQPAQRFDEDHLRMLRAVRFAAQLEDFQIEEQTAQAIKTLAPQIRKISAERILDELKKILLSPGRTLGIELADQLGLLEHILPQVHALHDQPAKSFTGQPLADDAFTQTLRVLSALPGRCKFETALAALLHLTGVSKQDPLECQTPIRTRLNSAQMNPSAICAGSIARTLTCSNQQRIDTVWLTQFLPLLGRADTFKLSEIKRIKIYGYYDALITLFRARTDAGLEPPRLIESIEQQAAHIDPETLVQDPFITGQDLQDTLGLNPGPFFQEILGKIYDAQLDETIKTKSEALDLARTFISRNS
ncbi:MAG: CCA tRNA nucleotidyltransferase [Phycisphaerae bacterium]|nr:CCA tRNA nucleotidyltransferase [Phycisphaerae bacterium]